MGKILSNETAARLMRFLNGPGDQEIPQRRGGATSRVPVLVRCTSATAAGGTETGHDQCYPAVVLNVNSLVDEQEETAEVWLTILDGGAAASPVTVAVPVEGNAYYGVYSGTFDPFPGSGSSDPRPRVFAIARAAGGGSIQVEDVDESPSVSSVTQIRFDSVDGFVVSSPGAGIARVDLAPATTTQNGGVTTSDQDWHGFKFTDEGWGVGTLAAPTGFIQEFAAKGGSGLDDAIGIGYNLLYFTLNYHGGNDIYVGTLVGQGGSVENAYGIWNGSLHIGITGSFEDANGNTITVTGGIITAITPP